MLQLIEGFETYGTSNGTPAPTGVMLRRGWNISLPLADGRVLGKSLVLQGGSFLQMQISSDTLTTKTIGIGFYPQLAQEIRIFSFNETAATSGQVTVRMNSSRQLEVLAAGSVHQTTALQLNLNQWYYIEFQATVHNSTGAYELRVNGVQQLTASGIDTQASTNPYMRYLTLGWSGGASYPSNTARIDDIYITDATGSDNTGFLGPCVVEAILADGDAGTNQWAPNSGTAHYDRVNQLQSDDDTTYLEDSVSGQRELFTFAAIATTGQIFGVQTVLESRTDDGGPLGLNAVAESDGAVSVGPTHTLTSTTYGRSVDIFETDPDTGDLWTQSALNLATFGFEVD